MNPETLALSFRAIDRAGAESQAQAWAAAEPNIAAATVLEVSTHDPSPFPSEHHWTVTIGILWRNEAVLTLGLVG
jgi:hypothetical protein